MSTPIRLAAFAALLVVLGLAGYGLGSVTGPVGPSGGEQHSREHTEEMS
jgi:hypothetical protein